MNCLAKLVKLCTVTYETSAAPYLAIKSLQQLAQNERDTYPLASKIMLNDFYVDDVLSGADNIVDSLQAQAELRECMQSGGFTLKKWISNCSEL